MPTFEEEGIQPSDIDIRWARENFSSRVLPILPNDVGGDITIATTPPEDQVLEHGLVATDGSNITTGSITFAAEDGILRANIAGINFSIDDMKNFSVVNGVVSTGEGKLELLSCTVTSEAVDGNVLACDLSYRYTLMHTINNETYVPVGDDVVEDDAFYDKTRIALYDTKFKKATGDLVIKVVDDVPTPVDDGTVWVTEDGVTYIFGDVTTNDSAGADLPLTFVEWSPINAAQIIQLNLYGTLVLVDDGTWSYTLDPSREITADLTDLDQLLFTLVYTVSDGDGDTDTAALVIGIQGSGSIVVPACRVTHEYTALPDSGVIDVSPYIQARHMGMCLYRLPDVPLESVKILASYEKRLPRFEYFGPIYMGDSPIGLPAGTPVNVQQWGGPSAQVGGSVGVGMHKAGSDFPILYQEVNIPSSGGTAGFATLASGYMSNKAATYIDLTNIEGGTFSLDSTLQKNSLGEFRISASVSYGGYDVDFTTDIIVLPTLAPGKHVISFAQVSLTTLLAVVPSGGSLFLDVSMTGVYRVCIDGVSSDYSVTLVNPLVYVGFNEANLMYGDLPFTPDYSYIPGVDDLTLEGPNNIIGFYPVTSAVNWAIGVTAPLEVATFLPDFEYYPLDPRHLCFADIVAEINTSYGARVLSPMSWTSFTPHSSGYPPLNAVAAATIKFSQGVGSVCTFPFGVSIETIAEGQKPKEHWTHCCFSLNRYSNALLYPPFMMLDGNSYTQRNVTYALPPYLTCNVGDSTNYGTASYIPYDMPDTTTYAEKLLPITADMWRTESGTGYFYIPFTLTLVA